MIPRIFILFCISIDIFIGCANAVKKNPTSFDTVIINVGKGPGSIETADFNKDGFTDIVVALTEDSSVAILLGNGKGKFTAAKSSPFFSNLYPNDIAIADFNNDEIPDLAIANTEVSFFTLLFGDGKGQFAQALKSPFGVNSKPHIHGIAAADFNADNYMDITTESWAVDNILVLPGDGKGNFGEQTFFKVGKRPYQRLRTADLDKDGKADIVTTNMEGNDVTVLLGKGSMNFQEAPGSPFAAGDVPFGIAIGDINADKNPDIAVVNSPTITAEGKGRDGLTILIGNGAGSFDKLKGSPFETGKSPNRLAIADIDGNGINDIAVANNNDKSISIFYMEKNAVGSIKKMQVGNHPAGIAINDMNGDGKNDILVSNYDDNTIMIFLNK